MAGTAFEKRIFDELAHIKEGKLLSLTEFEKELLAKKATKIVGVASFSIYNL